MSIHVVNDAIKNNVTMICGRTTKQNPLMHFVIEQRIGSIQMDRICKKCYNKYIKSKQTQTT